MQDNTVRKTHFRQYQIIVMWYLEVGDNTCHNNFVLCSELFIWHIYCYLCIYGAAHMLRVELNPEGERDPTPRAFPVLVL